MNRFEYKTYNTNMETEVQLTRALESVVRWRNYAEDLKKERDGWIAEYRAARAEIERLKERIDTANEGKKFTDEI